MAFISEADVEALVLGQLSGLGYAISSDAEIGPDADDPILVRVVVHRREASANDRRRDHGRQPRACR